jgi:photosystem II stability/assembly factor-like uncharacterized protein
VTSIELHDADHDRAVSSARPDLTGSDDGRLHLTRDGGATWTRVDTNLKGVPADTWIPAIEPSPHAAGTAFAVFDNHRRGDFAAYVARTDDFGRSWKSLATPSLEGYALAIVQDPSSRGCSPVPSRASDLARCRAAVAAASRRPDRLGRDSPFTRASTTR